MTSPEIQEAVAKGVAEGVATALSQFQLFHCRYQITPEQHKIQHDAMERFIAFTARLESLKWGVAQKIVVVLVLGLFGLLTLGAAMKLKILSGLGWPGR